MRGEVGMRDGVATESQHTRHKDGDVCLVGWWRLKEERGCDVGLGVLLMRPVITINRRLWFVDYKLWFINYRL